METLASLEEQQFDEEDAMANSGLPAGGEGDEGDDEGGGDGFGTGGAGFFRSFRRVPKNTKERINQRMVRPSLSSLPLSFSSFFSLSSFFPYLLSIVFFEKVMTLEISFSRPLLSLQLDINVKISQYPVALGMRNSRDQIRHLFVRAMQAGKWKYGRGAELVLAGCIYIQARLQNMPLTMPVVAVKPPILILSSP